MNDSFDNSFHDDNFEDKQSNKRANLANNTKVLNKSNRKYVEKNQGKTSFICSS